MNHDTDVIIIGAGMAGLSAATELRDAGASVVVIDKGRGVGGRMATRRSGEARFDHGAQFFTVRSPEFRAAVDSWLKAGIVEKWADGFPRGSGNSRSAGNSHGAAGARSDRDGHPRYRGVPAMTSIAKGMSEGVDLRLSTRVSAVKRRGEGERLEVATESGETLTGRSVVLTPPVPQSRELLEAGGLSLPEELRGVVYDQCLVLLAVEPKVGLPAPGALQRPGGSIDWMADNAAKGVSAVPGALTVHFAPEFSSRYYEAPDEEVAAAMLREIRALPPFERFSPEQYQVKRWRYSKPRRPLNVGALALPGAPEIILAGDAFSGARVEGAFLSGLAAAGQARAVVE